MDKLELRHLAPYLPYGLKVLNEYNEVSEIDTICWSKDDFYRTYLNLKTGGNPMYFLGATLDEIKPILRPMLDFNSMENDFDISTDF